MASCKLLFVLLATVFMFLAPAVNAQCEPDGVSCQPDGSTNCCSGFCYKQVGWAAGYCRAR
ncbi:antimicrobial peptide Alo-3-like [Leptopilina heterotoma]|uniref:antimicrobial peptide Alo-3-like n=1 Tax=Leptopilina heterotoma TaxID=63436 RepID=UPI001CA7D76E|nr:antimicrobial peptide Alo-3-like [Leptopilina heterotoma]